MLGQWGSVGAYVAGALPVGSDPSTEDRKVWLIAAYIISVLSGLLLLATLVMIRRILVTAHQTSRGV